MYCVPQALVFFSYISVNLSVSHGQHWLDLAISVTPFHQSFLIIYSAVIPHVDWPVFIIFFSAFSLFPYTPISPMYPPQYTVHCVELECLHSPIYLGLNPNIY